MHVHVNGEELETKTCFLAELLTELGFEGNWLATAVNNEVVPAEERTEHRVCENDRIEVLSPMQGG